MEFALIAVLGVVAGTVNTMVGGGSYLILPVLDLLAIPADVANGTNRLAVFFQSITGVASLRHHGQRGIRRGLVFAGEAGIGGVFGAYLATSLDPELFRAAMGWILLAGIGLLFVRPKERGENEPAAPRSRVTAHVLATLFGVYGGFLGAGVGVLILLFLSPFIDGSLVKTVLVKVLMVLVLSGAASVVYLYRGKVNFDVALPLILGNLVGGFIGGRLTVKGGERWLRLLVAVIAVAMALGLIFRVRP